MRFHERLNRPYDGSYRNSSSARLPRRRRLNVENLEERTLLSATATVSESDVEGVPTVTVEIKGVDHTYTPPSGAAFQFNRNGFTVNILNTSAEIPVIVAGIDDTVNVGNAGSLAGIDAPVTFAPRSGYRTLN